MRCRDIRQICVRDRGYRMVGDVDAGEVDGGASRFRTLVLGGFEPMPFEMLLLDYTRGLEFVRPINHGDYFGSCVHFRLNWCVYYLSASLHIYRVPIFLVLRLRRERPEYT